MKVIIACSSLQDHVDFAQSRAGTNHPVIYLNKLYHRDLAETMLCPPRKEAIVEVIADSERKT